MNLRLRENCLVSISWSDMLKMIAMSHRIANGSAPDKLLPRLAENEIILIETYDLVTTAATQNRRIEPAAEWLLDNFYLLEEQIRVIRQLLPPSFSRELPRLLSSDKIGNPRVYDIALELIAHVDGRIDAASLNGFIASYQSIETLHVRGTMGVTINAQACLNRESTPCCSTHRISTT